MFTLFSNFKKSIVDSFNDTARIIKKYPGTLTCATFSGLCIGAITYLSVALSLAVPEDKQAKKEALAALKQISDLYNCTVTDLPENLRNVEFDCADAFIESDAKDAANQKLDEIYNSNDGLIVGTTFASLFGGAGLGFFATLAALKAKECREQGRQALEALKTKESRENVTQLAQTQIRQ